MNTPTRKALGNFQHRSWTFALATFIIALTVASVGPAQTLQKGISVEMAVSSNATPMPEADQADAFIVSITSDGSVYLGVNRISMSVLREKVRSTPFRRGQKLYIKADARTSYATVLQVLDATSSGGIAPQVLLTSPTAPATTGAIVPPVGVEVQLGANPK
jgi:biopolymer transport protein ExbD